MSRERLPAQRDVERLARLMRTRWSVSLNPFHTWITLPEESREAWRGVARFVLTHYVKRPRRTRAGKKGAKR